MSIREARGGERRGEVNFSPNPSVQLTFLARHKKGRKRYFILTSLFSDAAFVGRK